MRKPLVGAVLAAGLVVAMGGTASAGEITGTGEVTPIESFRAGSICSFSGLNDDPDATEEFESGRVQSFGDIVQEAVDVTGDRGASTLVPTIREMGPGVSCRGYASGG